MSSVQSAAQIREAFLRFFERKGHRRVASSSLIPFNDPTLLFTNAGMNQFKDCFLGLEKRDYVRAVSSQKCVRAGGKHNDLDNVGYTARHHTFFEMLGNFSFGDYFKKDAIAYAWEFLTSSEWLNIPKERLYVTVYATDDEAFDLWHNDIGLPPERIIRIGNKPGGVVDGMPKSDNFWAMGDTGPCGPCTEIFYDHGDQIAGGLPGTPEEDGDRYIEIWNNVFMQFNRTADGVMHDLPAPSVDTGMGLERISAVLQHVHSNYEIDIFSCLIAAAAQAVGTTDLTQASLRVIADHTRSCSFLIADGVLPGNEGRGYVLRRIIRRAIRHGHKLGAQGLFFYKMVQPLIDVMGEAYPELVTERSRIEQTLRKEEEQFARTLDQGMRLLEGELSQLKGTVIGGDIAFKLYDTYGFPLDLTADIARERGLTIDSAEFERHMQEQRQRARNAGQFNVDYNNIVRIDEPTRFGGYDATHGEGTILALYKDGQRVEQLSEGDEGLVVLNHTPFYAESGGQVGDSGTLKAQSGIFEVQDTQKSGPAFVHQGLVTVGQLTAGQKVAAHVEPAMRAATARNHSATHLLHAALREVLGEHVNQKGSLVSSQGLRFDFAHDQAVTSEQLRELEQRVMSEIIANTAVTTEEMDMEQARARGAMMLFGEKYGERVRVLAMGQTGAHKQEFSIELCGGTHVNRTGDIGVFKIVQESGIAAGIRRIEALTGLGALSYIQAADSQLNQLALLHKVSREQVSERILVGLERQRELEKQVEHLKQKMAGMQSVELMQQVQTIGGVPVLIAQLEMDAKTLRTVHDSLKSRLNDAVLVLVGQETEAQTSKISLLISVAKQHTAMIKASDILSHMAQTLGGKGGGKPDLAQGGAVLAPEQVRQVNTLVHDLPSWLAQYLKAQP